MIIKRGLLASLAISLFKILLGAAVYLAGAFSARLTGQQSPNTIGSAGKQGGQSAEYYKVVPLKFRLADSYGRDVRSGDFRGAPVLIMMGSCWCGGCQSDAEPLRLLEEKYRAGGLQVIRSVSYDNELPAWEFQKHYGLPFVQLMDPLREFEKRYNRDGWTFIMLADSEGKVVYRHNGSPQEVSAEIERLLETMLPVQSPAQTVKLEGISYLPATVKRSGETEKPRQCDRFPSLACAGDGRMYVALTSNRGGTQDVYLRVFDGKRWLPDRPVAATEADEFDGTVIVDRRNRPWISWTSNAGGSPYNIFVSRGWESSSASAPIQITHSEDGAMHARMAADARGRIWVTYFQWQLMHGVSRDKEVYARYLERDRWSPAIHVSPEDVPAYEDHTDPAIAAIGDAVVIGWSWDFHRPNRGYSLAPNQPSIFLRRIEPGANLERARAISGDNTDTRPTIAAGPDGRIWCAWESVILDQRARGIRKTVSSSIDDLNRDEQPGAGTNVTGMQMNICTPCLAASSKGDVSLLWAETNLQGQWMLKKSQWDEKKGLWADPKTLLSQGNPRFPSAAYAKDGTLWVAYCVDNQDRREVAILKTEKED